MHYENKNFNLLISFFVCVSLHAQQKIIGGSAVDISQRPFQAAVFIDGNFSGGGVIINNQWILTVAHVTKRADGSLAPVSSIKVSTGYTNLNNDTQKSSVSQVIRHSSVDIALLKLSSPLTFSSTRMPIYISMLTTYSSGTTATVSGWGRRAVGEGSSLTQLYKTDVTIESCASDFLTIKKSSTSAYKGDSGGPLTISTSDGNLLVGIVKGGDKDIPSSYPTYYINVGTYRNWITSYTELYFFSGPDLINSGATVSFTISAPGGTLELSPNLSIVSQSRKNYTIKANGNGRAYINLKAGNNYVVRKPLWVGAPIVSGITYNGSTLTAETFGGDAHISRTEWTIGGNVFTAYDKFISSPYSSGTYTVSVKATNSCGTSSAYTTQISFSDRGTFSLTVEPGSRIVTVTPVPQEEEDDDAFALAGRKSATNATLRYVLADLTTGNLKATGYLPESGGTLDFSDAPAGMYVFKLYTSTGAEETFKISLK